MASLASGEGRGVNRYYGTARQGHVLLPCHLSDKGVEEMKKYKIETYTYGTFFRYARNPVAAKMRIVYAVFGRGYDGWEHDYWQVEEVRT